MNDREDSHGEDDYRVVIGEECFDWRALTDTERRDALDALAEVLEPLADGRRTAFLEPAYDTECLPSVTLTDALYTKDGGLPPDERRLLGSLLDKCRMVEPEESDLPQPVRVVEGPWQEPSWGVTHALSRAAAGRATTCLLTWHAPGREDWPSGWITVEREPVDSHDGVQVHLLRAPEDTPGFWRGVYTHETHEPVSADRFFTLTEDAFPGLLFAESLSLSRFKGSYAEVLPWLVQLLGALSDHFAHTLAACSGDQNQVMARFSAMDLDISPESANTKKNAKAWAERNVTYRGSTYRCEWHGKRLWDRDRVHFSLPIPAYDDRVLVGVFRDHLS
ncbi:hypothetical protein PV396_19135 [Streptomyces sp. ME02-8801-2C]|uniref:hypothetical protein n=1 Tax=Streptomyces sp. ME02-8801-2C TaxID=3028680 RepID=UPI0029BB539F|nr:hypothetical protein [Streptomyces sp. ME02-8801-2C]MDX3454033.1 hypothetical protein [Streptomyces sp. ME02-8801-2C]